MNYRRRWTPFDKRGMPIQGINEEIRVLENEICKLHGLIQDKLSDKHWKVRRLRWLKRRFKQHQKDTNK